MNSVEQLKASLRWSANGSGIARSLDKSSVEISQSRITRRTAAAWNYDWLLKLTASLILQMSGERMIWFAINSCAAAAIEFSGFQVTLWCVMMARSSRVFASLFKPPWLQVRTRAAATATAQSHNPLNPSPSPLGGRREPGCFCRGEGIQVVF